jgi:sialic acid synthase SpsE
MTDKTYLIAEMGCNHGGDLAAAMLLVDIAADAGVCAVKLQIRDVSVCEPGWENKEYKELVRYARMYNLDVGASVWSMSALDIAEALDFDWLKIPSACLHNKELVAATAHVSTHPVILSTGMSSQAGRPVSPRAALYERLSV